MKLSETLQGIGRPVAFYPGLRKITGSTTATILLCQLFYWTGKEASGDGWIYKTSDELTEETGLSYDEQVTARKHLVERELIEDRYARLEHKLYFRVCTEKINDIWENGETGIAKMGKDVLPVSTKAELPNSLNRTTETTQEITSEKEEEKEEDEKTVFTFYQTNIALITSFTKDELGEMIDTYTAHWVLEALKDCVEYNAKSLKYAKAILAGWKVKGFRSDTRSQTKASKNKLQYSVPAAPVRHI